MDREMDRCDRPYLRTLFESAPGLAGETEDHLARTSGRWNRTATRGRAGLALDKRLRVRCARRRDWGREPRIPPTIAARLSSRVSWRKFPRGILDRGSPPEWGRRRRFREKPTDFQIEPSESCFAERHCPRRETSRFGTRSLTIAQLCDHFEQRELAKDNTWRSHATKKTYQAYLNRLVRPHWRYYELAEVRTIQVESCLRRLPLAKSSGSRMR